MIWTQAKLKPELYRQKTTICNEVENKEKCTQVQQGSTKRIPKSVPREMSMNRHNLYIDKKYKIS